MTILLLWVVVLVLLFFFILFVGIVAWLRLQKWSERISIFVFDFDVFRALFENFNVQKRREYEYVYHFHFDMCLMPQNRALSQHLSFQTCSEDLRSIPTILVLRATAARTF